MKHKTMVGHFLLFLALVHLALPSVTEPKVVRVSYPSPNAFWLPFFVGVKKGIYQRHGLEIELIRIRGIPTALQVLIAGDITLVLGGTSAGILAIERGTPIVMVMGLVNEPQHEVFALPEIQGLEDLRGKNVASGTPGSPPDFVMRMALGSVGLSVTDVNMVNIAGSDGRLAALKNKSVFAIPLSPPFTYRAEEMGFKRLLSLKKLVKEFQSEVVFVDKKTVKNDPELIKSFVEGTLEAVRYTKKNLTDSVNIFMSYAGEKDREIAEKTVKEIVPSMPSDGRFTSKGIQIILDYLVKVGLLQGMPPSVDRYIDTRFITKRGP